MPGYQGKILRVDLGTGKTWVEEKDEMFYRRYWGGRGIIAYYLLNEVPREADPLGPENVLVFAAGPLTGAPFAGSGRNSVGAKSPLTGGYGDAEGGGFFGAELKRAGFDAIVIKGCSEKPVYLYVHDGEAELKDASHLWGKTTGEVEDLIKEELGDRLVRVAQCGPAGENLVRFACVANDLTHFAGRTGMGAVMGSKKLRAVAVRGKGQVQVANPEKLRELARWMTENAPVLAPGLTDTGTAGGTVNLSVAGGLPTRNFKQGSFEGAEKISGQTMRDTVLVDRDTCYSCPIRCKRVVKTETPYKVDPRYGGPEYETIGSLGSNLGIDDLVAICKGNELCNAYGLDTISTGVTIAFAMECFERGLFTLEETGGLDLRFGNKDAVLKAIELIKERKGFGDLLALGSRELSRRIGCGAEDLAMHVRGQEIPMHEPRLKYALGIGYAVSPTGADHCHNFHDTGYEKADSRGFEELKGLGIYDPLPASDLSPEKIHMFWTVTNLRTFANVAVICQFVPWSVQQLEELVRAVTGWNTTAAEILAAGERANTMARVFNLREGIDLSEERLPKRFFQAFSEGPLAGKAADPAVWEKAKITAYKMAGWTEEGIPTKECLARLGIGWASKYLPDKG
ncbi:MAG: aldehyde ferredoxin oxidoreductase family protein [Candidatus Fermentithermobacillus carboniphilus]|uniref:Aldehyde ferredoxin oxidoreductase family protein n=1 Tax=Candidatus Fermentithermobacillus carboniphilus TaxID=3085328 RepID=A0AAT9LCK1_9FIRM|nr:MAG: aldehyde ferredoxin oxidoreductase family protein [Candidatus Fermentithermobacillus carboniphilus]